MSALRDKPTQTLNELTYEHPGTIDLGVADHVLSRVAVWYEDGDYVVRSLEFDVMASAADVGDAIQQFVSRTIAYASLLARDGNPTHEDLDLALMIFQRLARIAEAMPKDIEQSRRRGSFVRRVRPRRQNSAGWSLHHEALT